MEIKEKTNIDTYLSDEHEDCFILSIHEIFDEIFYFDKDAEKNDYDDYVCILPKKKACFELQYQGQKITAYVEKIDKIKKKICLSQTHWLYMKNIIKSELGLQVKIKKRYPGKLTVCELLNSNQIIDKESLKRLFEAVSEKIYVKSPKKTN